MRDDRYGNAMTTGSDAARDAYVEGVDHVLAATYGARAAFETALAAYRARDFSAAANDWRALAAKDWPGADLSGAMAGFADIAADEVLPDDWDGAVVMTTK